MMIDIGIKEYIVRETPIPLAGCKQEVVGEIVRCKDCKHRGTDDCPMYFEEQVEWEEDGGYIECDTIYHDYTEDDGFCDRGERKDDG